MDHKVPFYTFVLYISALKRRIIVTRNRPHSNISMAQFFKKEQDASRPRWLLYLLFTFFRGFVPLLRIYFFHLSSTPLLSIRQCSAAASLRKSKKSAQNRRSSLSSKKKESRTDWLVGPTHSNVINCVSQLSFRLLLCLIPSSLFFLQRLLGSRAG